jgi:hypothetical protein
MRLTIRHRYSSTESVADKESDAIWQFVDIWLKMMHENFGIPDDITRYWR